MREIKYKAWLIKEERWANPDDIMIIGDGTVYVRYLPTRTQYEPDVSHTLSNQGNKPGFELMQYTGLKDKNGVDIFEGDILKWTIPKGTMNPAVSPWFWGGNRIDEDTTTISQVVYENACFSLLGVGEDEGWETMLRGGLNRDEYGEVIGNIWENRDLLNGI